MAGRWFAGGSGGCTGGKPTAGARAPGQVSFQRQSRAGYQPRALPAPGPSRHQSSVAMRQLPSCWRLTTVAPAPLSCIRSRSRRVPAMCRSPAIRARPSPGTTRGSRQTAEAAGPSGRSGRPRRHLYSRPVTCPRLLHCPGLVLSQRGFQVSIADRQGHQFHCFHWAGRPSAARWDRAPAHLRSCIGGFPPPRPGTAFRRRASGAAGSGWNGMASGETPGDRRQELPASRWYRAVVSAAGGMPTWSCSSSTSSW